MYNTAEFVCEKNNIKYNWRDNIIYILFYTTKLYLEMYMTTVLIFFYTIILICLLCQSHFMTWCIGY